MIQAPPLAPTVDRHLVTMPSRAWYGDVDLTLDFPGAWKVHTLAMKDAPSLTPAQIEAAFANPIGAAPIHQLAQGRKSATIIVDDLSRPTPASVLIPYVLRELATAGIPKTEIRFVIGGGSHRPLTQEEFEKKLGAEIVAEYAVKSHNFMAGDLKGIGSLDDGTPLFFDPWVVDADFKMTIGGIYPHGAVGFGGGSKLILPGVAGFATIFHFHTFYPSRGQGNIERSGDLPDHRDASEAAARALGLDLVVNAVINSRRQVAGLFVGDFVKAQRAGAHFAQEVFGTTIPEAMYAATDLVVVNAYPLDSDPIQTSKALWCRRLFPKARFIVVNPAVDGICYHGLYDRIDWKRYSAQTAARQAIEDARPELGGLEQAIIWSQHYSAHDFPRKQPKDALVRSWEQALALVQPVLPEQANVAVFPTSGLQLLAENNTGTIYSDQGTVMPYFYSPDERASKTLFDDISARTFWGEKMLLSLVDLPAHSVVPMHSHPHEQLGYLVKGEVTFTIGGEKRLLKVGDIWVIPGGVEHMVETGAVDSLAIDVFSPVREDYKY